MAPRGPEEDTESTVAMHYDGDGEPASSPHEERAYLIMLAGSRVGQMFKIERSVVIGRGPDADVQVIDDGVSRAHVRLTDNGDGSVDIEDLGSRNGTYVNGTRVSRTVLHDGDKIHVGQTTILKFSYADQLDERFQQELYQAAVRDALTGLYNRRYLTERLSSEFHFAQRHGTPLTLVMFDLDHFKDVNDAHGHPTGDHVLIAVARALSRSVRGEDIVTRYGGEEFVLLCRNIHAAMGSAVANRIRQNIFQAALVESKPDLRVSFSGGVASAPHPKILRPDDLLGAADKALYAAKAAGRNRIVIFE